MIRFNPAVTIAQAIRSPHNFPRSDVLQVCLYLVAQFCGGICGGFFASIIGGKAVCGVHTFVDTDAFNVGQALLGEFLFCAILVSLNVHLATDKRVAGNQVRYVCAHLRSGPTHAM